MRRLSMLMYTTLLAGSTICAHGISAQAAPPSRDPRATMLADAQRAISAYAWLIGEWEGTATVYTGVGNTMTLIQHESVTSAAFGTALVIQGRGSMERNGTTQQVWDAAALFAYNAPSKTFSFTSAGGSGLAQMFAVDAHGDGFTWSYSESASAKMRFVISRSRDGKWTEVGERSNDGGATWAKTIDLVLTKQK